MSMNEIVEILKSLGGTATYAELMKEWKKTHDYQGGLSGYLSRMRKRGDLDYIKSENGGYGLWVFREAE